MVLFALLDIDLLWVYVYGLWALIKCVSVRRFWGGEKGPWANLMKNVPGVVSSHSGNCILIAYSIVPKYLINNNNIYKLLRITQTHMSFIKV